jgi:hypothetical protein
MEDSRTSRKLPLYETDFKLCITTLGPKGAFLLRISKYSRLSSYTQPIHQLLPSFTNHKKLLSIPLIIFLSRAEFAHPVCVGRLSLPQYVSPPVPESWFLGSSYAASGSTPISIQAPLCIAGCDKNPPNSRIPSGALGQSVMFFRHVYTES